MTTAVTGDEYLRPASSGDVGSSDRTRASIIARIAFVAVAAAFALLARYVYADVFATARVFDYMGVRVEPSSAGVRAAFLFAAVLPALWLPVHLRTPSDLAQLFLYYAVHVQTAVLMPLVSRSPLNHQAVFVAATTAALLVLDARRLLPRLRFPAMRPDRRLFWLGVAAFYLLCVVVFARSGYLTLTVAPDDVYGLRAELRDRAAELGGLFFRLSLWSGAVLAPFLVVAGLHLRRPVRLVLPGVVLAWMSFVVSSNRSSLIAVPAVLGGYYLLRYTRGRHLAAFMGAAFIALTAVLLLLDARIGLSFDGATVPALTFQIFFRTFSNNGFLSAIYLDTFRTLPDAYYADSFLRWLPGPRLGAPVALIAGATFTDVLGNFANANLWADAYANLGYIGIAVAAVFTALVFWVYDGASAHLDRRVAAALLIVPATVLANTATQTALTSNGVLLLFVLVPAWAGRARSA